LILSVVSLALGLNAVHKSWLTSGRRLFAYAAVVLLPIVGATWALIMLDPTRRPTPSRLAERFRDELDRRDND
ncbi:MAG: hypothetical protein AAFV30_09535, partial [Pseudomonadota bacterium]